MPVKTIIRAGATGGSSQTARITWNGEVEFATACPPDVTLDASDTARLADTFKGTADQILVNRSGTPDSDMLGDAWADAVLANQGVNHGNESPLSVADQGILATRRDAFIKYDLTRFANFSVPTGGTLVWTFWDFHGLAVGVNVTAIFSQTAASPFTESTINWTNRPGDGETRCRRLCFQPS